MIFIWVSQGKLILVKLRLLLRLNGFQMISHMDPDCCMSCAAEDSDNKLGSQESLIVFFETILMLFGFSLQIATSSGGYKKHSTVLELLPFVIW